MQKGFFESDEWLYDKRFDSLISVVSKSIIG